jgi:hypothetical protein
MKERKDEGVFSSHEAGEKAILKAAVTLPPCMKEGPVRKANFHDSEDTDGPSPRP